MSNFARLTIGADREAAASDEAPFELVGRNEVPLLWSCGFLDSELVRKESGDDDDRVEEIFFETTASELRRRLESIAGHVEASANEYIREVWEGCAIVAQILVHFPANTVVLLDANEVAPMWNDGEWEGNAIDQMRTFAELRSHWNPERACRLTQHERHDVLTGTLRVDRKRVRRVTNAESDRAGFFALLFGTARGTSAATLQTWLDAAPRAEPLRLLEEEAVILADAMIARGLIVLGDPGPNRLLSYLKIAARYRTPTSLQEILDVLFAQRIIKVGTFVPTRWRIFDRVVGPDQAAEVPLFDEEVLRSFLEIIGE